jgi:hypothetical protein
LSILQEAEGLGLIYIAGMSENELLFIREDKEGERKI